MNKIFIIVFLLVLSIKSTNAQFSSSSIKIIGDLKVEKTLIIDSILQRPAKTLMNIGITNYRGELNYTIKEAKGVSLLSVLSQVEFKTDKPKEFSSYVALAKSADNYYVTFSWNEIFNSPIGDNTYIIYELDGKRIADAQGGSFILYSALDKRSGRRYVKWLSEIKLIKL